MSQGCLHFIVQKHFIGFFSFRREPLCGGQGVFLLNVSVIANNDFFDQEGNIIFFKLIVLFVFFS